MNFIDFLFPLRTFFAKILAASLADFATTFFKESLKLHLHKKYSFADEILVLDKQINKSYIESLILQRTIDRARLNKIYDIVDIRQSRLDISQRQLTQARNEMATIYKRAKINRVWE